MYTEHQINAELNQLAEAGKLNSLPKQTQLYRAVKYRARLSGTSVEQYVRVHTGSSYEGRESRVGERRKGALKETLTPPVLFDLLEVKRIPIKQVAEQYQTTRQNVERIKRDYAKAGIYAGQEVVQNDVQPCVPGDSEQSG